MSAAQPVMWILYRRPAELPADALPGDWPGPFVARRFERNDKAELAPTEDVMFDDHRDRLQRRIKYRYAGRVVPQIMPRGVDDHPTIEYTLFLRAPHALQTGIIGDVMPGGMKSDEAVRLASAWWDRTGRHVLRREFNQERDEKTGEITDTIPSGILKCLPWAMLTRKEQVAVVLKWHDAKVEQQ